MPSQWTQIKEETVENVISTYTCVYYEYIVDILTPCYILACVSNTYNLFAVDIY